MRTPTAACPADVLIGDTTLEDLLKLPWQEAADLVAALPEPGSEWERVGDFLLNRRSAEWSGPQNLIFGISTSCPFGTDLRVVVYADNSAEAVVGTAWVTQQNALRSERGLPPLPALP